MKYKKLVLGLLFIFTSFFAQAHDYHTSITDIKYNTRTKSLEVAVKVFTDDLENALSRRSKQNIIYSSTSDKVRKYLENYLQATLTFELTKGKPLKYKLLGSEEEADAVWLYVEVPVNAASISQLYVKNAVLMDVFRDQMNIVNVNYKGSVSSELMQQHDVVKKFALKN